MTDLDWRPLTTADLPELAALIAVIRRHDGEPAVVTAQSLGQTFAELDWDPALDSLLAVDGTIAGYAGTARPRAGGQRVPTLGGVHPQWRGRGIGRRLLGWQLDRAHTQWVAAGAVEPWNFRTGGVDADGTAARLYARFGLVAVRHWLLMQRRSPIRSRWWQLPRASRSCRSRTVTAMPFMPRIWRRSLITGASNRTR